MLPLFDFAPVDYAKIASICASSSLLNSRLSNAATASSICATRLAPINAEVWFSTESAGQARAHIGYGKTTAEDMVPKQPAVLVRYATGTGEDPRTSPAAEPSGRSS